MLDELKKMREEDLDKPIICRMGEKENILTGRELKDILGGESLSFGSSNPGNPGELLSKKELADKVKRIFG